MLTQARKSLNVAGFSLKFRVARYMKLVAGEVACDNSHFSLLLAAGNVLWGRTSATRWQKFHTYVEGVNGPNTTHKLMIVWWWPYSFALMRISPSDFPVCVHSLAGNWTVKRSLWFYFTFVCYEYSHGLPGKSSHLFLGWSCSTGRFFSPLLFHNPYSGEILLMLKLMLEFVLNRCMFISGSNNGGSCEN